MENKILPVGCVLMASGLAVRFGSNKLLADFGGQPMLCRAFAATATPLLAARVVVTRSPEVNALCAQAGIPAVLHTLPGRNDTVRLGLDALLAAHPELCGCLFLPGDQPLLRRESIEALVRAFSVQGQTQKETEREILRLAYRAETDPEPTVGSPVLFGSGYFAALRSLPAGKGGGVLLRKYPERVQLVFAARREELMDVDDPNALEQLLQRLPLEERLSPVGERCHEVTKWGMSCRVSD